MTALFPCSEEILGKCSQAPTLGVWGGVGGGGILARFVAFKTVAEYFEVRIEFVPRSVLCEEMTSAVWLGSDSQA